MATVAIYIIATIVAVLLIYPMLMIAFASLQWVWGIGLAVWGLVTKRDPGPPERQDPRWF